MLGKMIANTFIKPYQSPVFDDPKNYGLDYEAVTFSAKDGVELSGWLIKGSTNKVIIQSHFGVQCSRSGYTREGKGFIKGWDEDVRFLRQAKYLNEAGYSVLMYDMRNHGKSSLGTLPYISWGKEEAKDVLAAVDFMTNHGTYKDAEIGLLSICMGQGASVAAFGMENGLKQYENIKCMISVQPMDYTCFVNAMGLPNFLVDSTTKSIKKQTGEDFNELTWRPFVKDITVPTLIIQNMNDSYLNEEFLNELYEELNVEKEILLLDLPKMKNALQNRMACYNWIGENSEPILSWFNKYLAAPKLKSSVPSSQN
ncbi:alpha/beta hydrolase [Acaryochloris marina]|uniref:Serine aminopeptidase S33 domain-containing protein n=1 Tax=Acaryochloris marina (strain MBIC 11017) TaxID=329726 RepID=B0C7M7_ACAM1|nr:alpha/beta hydrolase [Acaryochloris marina]ABW25287.1 conserved hypothetical protein [Acaryochloris marina MBIC11017]